MRKKYNKKFFGEEEDTRAVASNWTGGEVDAAHSSSGEDLSSDSGIPNLQSSDDTGAAISSGKLVYFPLHSSSGLSSVCCIAAEGGEQKQEVVSNP